MVRVHGAGWLGLPWWVWGLLSLLLAVVWLFVWPQRNAVELTTLRFWLLRWGHAATWFCLSANFFVRQWLPSASMLANTLALAGLAFYVAFMAAMLTT